jgi:hypothetical protein
MNCLPRGGAPGSAGDAGGVLPSEQDVYSRLTILCLLTALTLPSAALAQGGTITGVVTTSAVAPRLLRVTMDMKVCGTQIPDESIVVGAGGLLANAVVSLTGVKVTTPYRSRPSSTRSAASCRGCRSRGRGHEDDEPRRAAATTNAQQDGGRTLFNVGLPVPGMVVTRPLNGAGLVRITCNTHTWMRGFVVVTDDMAAVSGPDGRFQLTGVPPGTYELKVWHESLKTAPVKVTVTAGGTTKVALTLTK